MPDSANITMSSILPRVLRLNVTPDGAVTIDIQVRPPRVTQELRVGTPMDMMHVCPIFMATGTVSPSGTSVFGSILSSDGSTLIAGPFPGTTSGNQWACLLQVPTSAPGSTALLLEVDTAPPVQRAQVNIIVDDCL
jgi:hypothetical protein